MATTTLDCRAFPMQVEALVPQYDGFQITETIIRNMTAAVEAMVSLCEQGFRFALDDFRSGGGKLYESIASASRKGGRPIRFYRPHENSASRIIVTLRKKLAVLGGTRCFVERVGPSRPWQRSEISTSTARKASKSINQSRC